MATTKRSVTLEDDLVREAERLAGKRGFSRLLNEALRQHLQAQRLRALEAEFAGETAPLTDEERAWARSLPWPT
ncbi:MAG TPA: hypothetical protein VFW96_18935 [Thermomicrobiales bacterium]|nr:hypothetical protein [Thermomicrobiales bacterium]